MNYPEFRTVREVSLGKANMHRRHLDVGQRCLIGNELLRITLELEDKGESVLNSAHADKPPCRQKIEGVAKALNVSVNSMAKAAALIKQDPEEAQEVLEDKKSLHASKVATDSNSDPQGTPRNSVEPCQKSKLRPSTPPAQ